ncbi:MAG: TadE/TadG family type IV pilus assembly protein [Pseudomonadota bacterium]
MSAFRKAARRFVARRDGTTAVEFAFAASGILIFVMVIMEIAMMMFANTLLEGGIRQAARFGITQADPDDPLLDREDMIAEIINDHGIGLLDVDPNNITTLVYPDFNSIGNPEPWNDDDGNGEYDAGEDFTDMNCNGAWDDDMGFEGAGGSSEVVLYTVNHDWQMMTGFLNHAFGGGDGVISLTASVAVRNEPVLNGTTGC